MFVPAMLTRRKPRTGAGSPRQPADRSFVIGKATQHANWIRTVALLAARGTDQQLHTHVLDGRSASVAVVFGEPSEHVVVRTEGFLV